MVQGDNQNLWLDRLLWAPRSWFTDGEIEDLRERLTFTAKQNESFKSGPPAVVSLLVDDPVRGLLGFPRHFGTTTLREDFPRVLDGRALVDARPNMPSKPLPFLCELWENQKPLVERLSQHIESGALGGILQAPPGSGKTIMTLAVIARHFKPTLIIVRSEFLLDQWRERVKSALPIGDAMIGLVQADTCDFEGKPIVIGMLQSLYKRDYPTKFFESFGFVIVDECHSLGAEQFYNAMLRFNCDYICGVSATPRRSDSMDAVFTNHIGPVVAKSGSWAVEPSVYVRHTGMRFADPANRNGQFLMARILNAISSTTARNDLVAQECQRAYAADRNVLLLSDRLNQLNHLATLLVEKGVPKDEIGFYIGGLDSEEREAAAKCRIILGTYQLIREAVDLPDRDTLLLATPRGNVEQAVGRILRQHEGKKAPIVVDFVDVSKAAGILASQRRRLYSRKNWKTYDVGVATDGGR